MRIDTRQACALLREHDYFVILAHHKPDGDALGSCFALMYMLESLGKTARVESPDGIPQRYRFLCEGYAPKTFEPAFVISADVAGPELLGSLQAQYESRIDLCIDHHGTNTLQARYTLLDARAPAAGEIVYDIMRGLGIQPDARIANALFTGISTDTGCFKYTNVTARTHRIAAELIEAGAQHGEINRLMFDTQSRGRLEIEKIMLDTLEYYFDDRCAVITVYMNTPEKYGVTEDELDGISALPRRIQGVKVGVTIREKKPDSQRISLRTDDDVDASKICARLGGGGHPAAAGCTVQGTRDEAKQTILAEIKKELDCLLQ